MIIPDWKKMSILQGLYRKVWNLNLHSGLEMWIEMEMFINLYHSHIQQDLSACFFNLTTILNSNFLGSCL